MRATICFWALILGVSAVANWTSGEEGTTRVRLELQDGGSVVGSTHLTAIDLDIGFDALRIPIGKVSRVDRLPQASADGAFTVQLNNQDVITGRLRNESIPIHALYGRVNPSSRFLISLEVLNDPTTPLLPVRRNLILHFPFDQIDDGLTQNVARTEHRGRVRSLSLVDRAVKGQAGSFYQQSQVLVDHHLDLTPECFSIGAWVNPRSGSSGYEVVAAKTNPSSWYGGYGLIRNSGDERHIHFFVNGYTQSVVKAEIPVSEWTHVLGVCDGETIQIYADGKLKSKTGIKPVNASSLGNDLQTVGLIHHVPTPLAIGYDSHHYAWNGKLDDFVFYGRALTVKEIERLYNDGRRRID